METPGNGVAHNMCSCGLPMATVAGLRQCKHCDTGCDKNCSRCTFQEKSTRPEPKDAK